MFPLVVHSFHIKLSSTIQLEDLLWFIRLEVLPMVHSFHIKLYNPVGGPAMNYSVGGPSDWKLLSCSIYVHSFVGVQCWSLVHWTNAFFLDRGMPTKKRAVGSASSIWSYAMKQRDRTQLLLKLRNSTNEHAERTVSCVLQLVWMVKRISPCCSLVSHQTVKHNPVGGPAVNYSVGGPSD